MNVVLDTNILVSALWTPNRKPAAILNALWNRRFTICYDYRILIEYENVLRRPKFKFQDWEINSILDFITKEGLSVVPFPLPDVIFTDESDKKFYETAKFCNAIIVTGNLKHYPNDPCILSASDFCDMLGLLNL